jgi:hypothetical protein
VALSLRLHLQVPPFAFLKAFLLILGFGLWTKERKRHIGEGTAEPMRQASDLALGPCPSQRHLPRPVSALSQEGAKDPTSHSWGFCVPGMGMPVCWTLWIPPTTFTVGRIPSPVSLL